MITYTVSVQRYFSMLKKMCSIFASMVIYLHCSISRTISINQGIDVFLKERIICSGKKVVCQCGGQPKDILIYGDEGTCIHYIFTSSMKVHVYITFFTSSMNVHVYITFFTSSSAFLKYRALSRMLESNLIQYSIMFKYISVTPPIQYMSNRNCW